jgi:hypothetical protein
MFYSGMSCLCFLAALSPSLKISTSQPAVWRKEADGGLQEKFSVTFIEH